MDRPDYLLSLSSAASHRPVLVLGHSLGTNFALWQSTLERLGDNRDLLRYDPHPRRAGTAAASIESRGRELLLRNTDFRERVQQIKARTLVIAGAHDRASTLSDAEFLHEQIRTSQLQVFPCGHLACIESAEGFAKAVTEFLSESV